MQSNVPCRSAFFILIAFFGLFSIKSAAYSGSHAYNKTHEEHLSVNTATGTFHFSYPLIENEGIREKLSLNLTYQFNKEGLFGLPQGWKLDLDFINKNIANLKGQQWIIDSLWNDETLFASGLKYFNQHGTQFKDLTIAKPIPSDPSRFYRFQLSYKDGSVSYFSAQGLLTLKTDRFGNRIQFDYEKPVSSLRNARLKCITDNYGNRYQFFYEPNEMRVVYPDKREISVYFDETGVIKLINPLKQEIKLGYTKAFDYNLIHSIETPTGLFVELTYNSIHYKKDSKTLEMPVVERIKKIDLATKKALEETHYSYSKDNNFTGYPYYQLSDNTDSLMDSNNQSYRYWVQVKHSDLSDMPTYYTQAFYYNYLHLPVEVHTLREGNSVLKVDYTYDISPFRYSRSTNYDKPTSITQYLWHAPHHQWVPTDKTTTTYDRYGNQTTKHEDIFDRLYWQWKPKASTSTTYFKEHYSLPATLTKKDYVTGLHIRHRYTLNKAQTAYASKVTESLSDHTQNQWEPWQKETYKIDNQGRLTYKDKAWLKQGQPGIQLTHASMTYDFDDNSQYLSVKYISALGSTTEWIADTKNSQLQKKITPLGETWSYEYDDLGRRIAEVDPEGYTTHTAYQSFQQHGLNSIERTSPLGYKARAVTDALKQLIIQEDSTGKDWRLQEARTYNGFGLIKDKTDKFNQVTHFTYDDLKRPLSITDPWQNQTRINYNDLLLITTRYLNNIKTYEKQAEPWNFLVIESFYPNFDNHTEKHSHYAETITKHNGFDKLLEETNSLVERYTLQKSDTVNRHYTYDTSLNLIKRETKGFDNLHFEEVNQRDIFGNAATNIQRLAQGSQQSISTGDTYLFNADNQLEKILLPDIENAHNTSIRHQYNLNGQRVKTTFPSDKTLTIKYDKRGLIRSESWSSQGETSITTFTHNPDKQITRMDDGQGQALTYEYYLDGLIASLTYPDNTTITLTYDDQSRLLTQNSPGYFDEAYHYHEQDKGQLSEVTFDGRTMQYEYGTEDNGLQGKLTKRRFIDKQGYTTETAFHYGGLFLPSITNTLQPHSQATYNTTTTFNARKQLTSKAVHAHLAHKSIENYQTHYDYDALNRLHEETHIQDEQQAALSYQYDANNNLVNETISSGSKQGQIHYQYNARDQLIGLLDQDLGNHAELTYDPDGRLLHDHRDNHYHYNVNGQLTKIANTHYSYWPNNLLAERQDQQNTQRLFQGPHKKSCLLTSSKGPLHLFRAHHGLEAGITKEGTEQLLTLHNDVGATLTSEGKLFTHHYSAFGQRPHDAHPTETKNYGWHQAYTDRQHQLVYFQSRFYSPAIKRFITPDFTAINNQYTFAKNNPLFFTDPTGHSAVVNYSLGSGVTLLGILGIAFAVPTGGASLTLTAGAGITAGVSAALSGISLLGSQAALDSGNKAAAKALQFTSIGLGLAAIVSNGIALAPAASNFFAEYAMQFRGFLGSSSSSLSSTTSEDINYTNALLRFLFRRESRSLSVVPEEPEPLSSISSGRGSPMPFDQGAPTSSGLPQRIFPPNANVDEAASPSSTVSGPEATDNPMTVPRTRHRVPVELLNWLEVSRFRDLRAPIETLEDDVFFTPEQIVQHTNFSFVNRILGEVRRTYRLLLR